MLVVACFSLCESLFVCLVCFMVVSRTVVCYANNNRTMSLLSLTIRTLMIVGLVGLLSAALCSYCERLRQRGRPGGLPKLQVVAQRVMALAALGLMFHLGYHRYFFVCQFTACKTTATPWLVAFVVAFVIQPVIAFWQSRRYTRQEWLSWLLLGCGAFGLAIVAGKAFCLFCYIAGREWIVR